MERSDKIVYPKSGEVFENKDLSTGVIDTSSLHDMRCPYCGKILFEVGEELEGTLRIFCKNQHCKRFLTLKFMSGRVARQ